MGQPVGAGSAYGLRPTLAWPVTWPATLKSRYVTWGALQVLYAFALQTDRQWGGQKLRAQLTKWPVAFVWKLQQPKGLHWQSTHYWIYCIHVFQNFRNFLLNIPEWQNPGNNVIPITRRYEPKTLGQAYTLGLQSKAYVTSAQINWFT